VLEKPSWWYTKPVVVVVVETTYRFGRRRIWLVLFVMASCDWMTGCKDADWWSMRHRSAHPPARNTKARNRSLLGVFE
jgi:hypothetical protein